jgi:hypothetical protein
MTNTSDSAATLGEYKVVVVQRVGPASDMDRLHEYQQVFDAARTHPGSHGIIWDHGTCSEDLMFVIYAGPVTDPESCENTELDAAIDRHLASAVLQSH